VPPFPTTSFCLPFEGLPLPRSLPPLAGPAALLEAPALFADRDDVTLGTPFGPYAKGKPAVLQTLAGAAAKYRDGSVVRVDRIAVYGDGNVIGLVEVEHDRAKVGGRPDLAEFSARVTSIYERIDGQWKLVHRHADPITAPRPADSVLQK
jgi:ketosteroid isomerase-like protein